LTPQWARRKVELEGETPMPAKKLREFLDSQQVVYETIQHPPAFTAQEIAALTHIRGKELAKTVIVKLDGTLAMFVLPAGMRVDLDHFARETGARKAELATEAEFRARFPECETGAMPPFGMLFGMEVFVADPLREDREIAFNAGTHRELVRMRYDDFERLVGPRVLRTAASAAH
jgi:Ala-tRNA(Pro) deacylase